MTTPTPLTQFVIVNPDTLEIVSRYYNDVSLFDQQSGSFPHFEISSSEKLQAITASRNEDDGSIVLSEDPVILNQLQADIWTAFRKERDARLLRSDWTMLPDVALENKDKWIEYRALLRLLPALTLDPAAPDWPIAPS